MTAEETLKETIMRKGPISIAEFMAFALYDNMYGYYRRKDPLGKEGDFVTAPEISQMFGEIIGIWLGTQWQTIGSPKNVALVELGPGRGTLMKDILRATKKIKGFHDSINIHLVELNEVLQKKQNELLKNETIEIKWHKNVSELPLAPTLLVANEFFDALPIHQLQKTEAGWREVLVGKNDNEELDFILSDKPPDNYYLIPEKIRGSAEIGGIFEISPSLTFTAIQIITRIWKFGGTAIIIDYGYYNKTCGNTLQSVMNHKHNHPLRNIGKSDLTAYVDFTEIKNVAEKLGVKVYGDLTQGEFLVKMGIELRAIMLAKNSSDEQKQKISSEVNRLISPKEMGTLFKCMAITHPDMLKPFPF